MLIRYYNNLSNLDQGQSIIAEYIWIDGTGITLRSKCKTLPKKVTKLEEIPDWNYDGSSTWQASTSNSEVILKPVAFYPDPFRIGDNIIVLCETYIWVNNLFEELKPANTNFRHFAKTVFDKVKDQVVWFGIEQEY